MGTWSKGTGVGLVALTLGLLACGGKYNVGSGDTAGNAGEGGSGDEGSGGSSTSGQGGSGKGGAATGGAGIVGGTAGVSGGGVAGVSAGGSSAGGTSGAEGCSAPAVLLPDHAMATPEVVWDRLSLFLYGARHPPFTMPETTTTDWVREMVLFVIDERNLDGGQAPEGLQRFMRDWAFGDDGAASAEFWAQPFARPAGNFADLFITVDDRVSFLTDRAFLVEHPNLTGRGVWIQDNLLCALVPLPPEGVHIDPVPVPPNMTRRQALEAMVNHAACAGCHFLLDPLGYSLEHYDTLGDYRTTENGLPIDSSGIYYGETFNATFGSIDDLAPQLLGACEVQRCFSQQLFQYALDAARPGEMVSYDQRELDYVAHEFIGHYLALAPLLQAITTTPAFLGE